VAVATDNELRLANRGAFDNRIMKKRECSCRRRRGESRSRFVEEVVNKSFPLVLRHGIPVQCVVFCEPPHLLLPRRDSLR